MKAIRMGYLEEFLSNKLVSKPHQANTLIRKNMLKINTNTVWYIIYLLLLYRVLKQNVGPLNFPTSVYPLSESDKTDFCETW